MIGDVPMYTPITTTLASHTGYIVVGIEYRCAPEHKCPAAHHDCVAAVRWIHEHAASLVSEGDIPVVVEEDTGSVMCVCV